MALLCAFHQLQLYDLGWSMHFVGKDFQDDYSTVLKEYVNNFDLNTSVLSMMLNMTFSIFYLNQLLEYWPQQLRDFR
jgi:hypothetical protein